jgi:hypothetical protein
MFTKAQLLAGINLVSVDPVNAACQDASDDTTIGWGVTIAACDISDCPTSISADSPPSGLSKIEYYTYDGPALYTDGSGTFPQFQNGPAAGVSADMGNISNYVLQLSQSLNYYADSSSMGDDSFGADKFKIQIQYDTSCNTSGGSCGSYSWTNAIDYDAYFAAGDGGAGNEQVFDIVEADCWNEDYIYVRWRVIAVGSCNTAIGDDWATPSEVDVASLGVQCNGGPP